MRLRRVGGCERSGAGAAWRLASLGFGGAVCCAQVQARRRAADSAAAGQRRGEGCRGAARADDQGAGEGAVRRSTRSLQFASKDTKLPIEHTVKRKLITRDEVNKYLREEVRRGRGREADGAVEIVLKKFGLLDRDFHLRPFLTRC